MRQNKKILSTYKKKVHINNEEWSWQATNSTVVICNPERTKKWKFHWIPGPLSFGRCRPVQVVRIIEGKILKTIKAFSKHEGTLKDPLVL